jgi:hypothetical protein
MTRRASILLTALLVAGSPALAVPILNEVLYDATGPDASLVFTEIAGCPGTSLDGWSLVGVNGASGAPYRTVDLTGALIPADGLLVVATASAQGDVLANRDFVGEVDWQNGPDAVELWNDLGGRVDALQYGALQGLTLGEGLAAEDVDAGLALTRDYFATDTDDNALDFLAAEPTPGSWGATPPPEPSPEPSPEPLPEPRGSTLLALGLGAIALRGRARRGRGRGTATPPRAAPCGR